MIIWTEKKRESSHLEGGRGFKGDRGNKEVRKEHALRGGKIMGEREGGG